MIDGNHTNRFIVVCICNKELITDQKEIMKQYVDYVYRDRVCDIVILGVNLPKLMKFHTIKVLGDSP